MIKSLYGKYFQKSKSFLYPALGIKKNAAFTPINTYLSIDGFIGPEDIKLVCVYDIDDSNDFKEFEKHMLVENPLFCDKVVTKDSIIYLFDFPIHQEDWFNFILGKYSKLSPTIKRAIKQYYGPNSAEYTYIDSFLYPKEYFEDYAILLDMDVESLKEIGELCDSCDLEKETVKIPKKYLVKLKKEC